jgi:hypothetical protein
MWINKLSRLEEQVYAALSTKVMKNAEPFKPTSGS